MTRVWGIRVAVQSPKRSSISCVFSHVGQQYIGISMPFPDIRPGTLVSQYRVDSKRGLSCPVIIHCLTWRKGCSSPPYHLNSRFTAYGDLLRLGLASSKRLGLREFSWCALRPSFKMFPQRTVRYISLLVVPRQFRSDNGDTSLLQLKASQRGCPAKIFYRS